MRLAYYVSWQKEEEEELGASFSPLSLRYSTWAREEKKDGIEVHRKHISRMKAEEKSTYDVHEKL